MSKSPSAEEVKLRTNYDNLRAALARPEHADRLEKPLAFWVLPSDRRLPLSFLPIPLQELLLKSFNELGDYPGIGRKKMHTFVKLLGRAVKNDPGDSSLSDAADGDEVEPAADVNQFNADGVSDLVWSKWRNLVRVRGLGYEKVGRLCPALRDVPTVIWNTPLSYYLDLTLADIRSLKTHGEKRVRVVLEVFHSVYRMLTTIEPLGGLAIRLAPKFAIDLENALAAFRGGGTPPTLAQLEQAIVVPLLRQLTADCGDTVGAIASDRLGVGTANGQVSVRLQARKLGVTRARIYQLLEECNQVMLVRWPEGRRQLDDFAHWLDEVYAPAECANLLASLRELLFPLKFDAVGRHLLKDAAAEAAI
jgi:hypothetical protein